MRSNSSEKWERDREERRSQCVTARPSDCRFLTDENCVPDMCLISTRPGQNDKLSCVRMMILGRSHAGQWISLTMFDLMKYKAFFEAFGNKRGKERFFSWVILWVMNIWNFLAIVTAGSFCHCLLVHVQPKGKDLQSRVSMVRLTGHISETGQNDCDRSNDRSG